MLYSQLLYPSKTFDPWVTMYQTNKGKQGVLWISVKEADKKDFDIKQLFLNNVQM